jgi:hypothetical protein
MSMTTTRELTATAYRYHTPPVIGHYSVLAVKQRPGGIVEFLVFDGDKITPIRSAGAAWLFPNGVALTAGALTQALDSLNRELDAGAL